ncbi:hypothetical protein SXHG_00038 [Synechococcus phage MRHenn-2013a]|nr:hypothetical protein SXHG_00038 [Synechococcus phage MRHenn-2013a]
MNDTKTYPQQHTLWKPACMVFNNGRIMPVGIYTKMARRESQDGQLTDNDFNTIQCVLETDTIIQNLMLNSKVVSDDKNTGPQ